MPLLMLAALLAGAGLAVVASGAVVSIGPLTATSGQAFTGTVAVFTDVTCTAPGCPATIGWGDGSGAGTTTAEGLGAGAHPVVGSHVYASTGVRTITVVNTAIGTTDTAFTPITVVAPPATTTQDQQPPPPPAPVASPAIAPASPLAGQPVT